MKAAQLREGVNLSYQVKEPQHYGVIEFGAGTSAQS